jgi:hypothetical protein
MGSMKLAPTGLPELNRWHGSDFSVSYMQERALVYDRDFTPDSSYQTCLPESSQDPGNTLRTCPYIGCEVSSRQSDLDLTIVTCLTVFFPKDKQTHSQPFLHRLLIESAYSVDQHCEFMT